MQDLIIVCAGGWGVDAYDLLTKINEESERESKEKPYNILGFLSDEPDALVEYPFVHAPILGPIQGWHPIGKEHYVIGLSDGKKKEVLVRQLKKVGAIFETIITPRTRIPESVTIGEGCYIDAFAIGQNTKIGNFVHATSISIGQNVVIGDYCSTGAFVNLASCTIGDRVFIGSHAVVLNHSKIGDDAKISACSLVLSNVKKGTTVIGVPAKRIEI